MATLAHRTPWAHAPSNAGTIVRGREDCVIMPATSELHHLHGSGAISAPPLVPLSLTRQLQVPSQAVKSFLQRMPKETGPAMFVQLKRAVSFLKEGLVGGPQPDTLELLDINLRDVHAVVLELDDDITDSLEGGYEDEAIANKVRCWLQQLQSFVVALQRDLDAIKVAGKNGYTFSNAPSTVSSLSIGGTGTGSNSCASSTTSSDSVDSEMVDAVLDSSVLRGQWDVLVRHSLDVLQPLLAEEVSLPGLSCHEEQSCIVVQGVKLSKVVCRRSSLSYRDHWANKVAV